MDQPCPGIAPYVAQSQTVEAQREWGLAHALTPLRGMPLQRVLAALRAVGRELPRVPGDGHLLDHPRAWTDGEHVIVTIEPYATAIRGLDVPALVRAAEAHGWNVDTSQRAHSVWAPGSTELFVFWRTLDADALRDVDLNDDEAGQQG